MGPPELPSWVDVPPNTEAEHPTVLEDGNQATVSGPYRITVLVRRPVSTCQRANRRTRLWQRNCRESVSSETVSGSAGGPGP
jgi:hypothetical protein